MKIPNKTIPPKWFTATLYPKGGNVTNHLTEESIDLTAVELSLYDLIRGFEGVISALPPETMTLPKALHHIQKEVLKARDWFMKNNLEAYKILID